MNRFIRSLAACLILLCPAAAMQAQVREGGAPDRTASARVTYAFASWPEGAIRKGVLLEKIGFEGYKTGKMDFAAQGPVVFPFLNDDGAPAFLVELHVALTTLEARERLLDYLGLVASSRPVPNVREAGIEAGDRGYVGFSQGGRIAWIAFVRGNIAVRLCCLDPRKDPHPDMGYLAERLDKILLAEPVGPMKPPRIEKFSAQRPFLKAGEDTVLDLKTDEDPVAVVFEVGGEGQGYVEEDGAGKWRLYTTREGAMEVTCHVLGAMGARAKAGLSLEVAAE